MRMMKRAVRPILGVALGAMLLPAPAAWAQRETMLQIVKLAGTMDAAGRACGDYTEADLQNRKRQEKVSAAAQGVSAAEFETIFKAAQDKAKAQLASVTPAEKAKACQQLRGMAGK